MKKVFTILTGLVAVLALASLRFDLVGYTMYMNLTTIMLIC